MDIMKKILEQTNLVKMPKIGEIVQGTIVTKGNASVFVDLGLWGTGIIYGREFYEAKTQLKGLKQGDVIFAKIVDLENDDGYIELSVTKAGKELAWETLRQKKDKGELITVRILGANKGGLLTEVLGVPAFLPVSQLAPQNYPKVEGGDNMKILKALQQFVGKEMEVKIFDVNPQEEKLILSEKAKAVEKIKDLLKNYQVGEVVEGEITGIVDFGAFIKFPGRKSNEQTDNVEYPENLEGLIHISELDWQLISNPADIVKIGQKVQAKIIDISGDKISLSLKALQTDPWNGIEEKFQKDNTIKGQVTKLNPFGAFVQVAPKIQGLCHVSEFGSQKTMEETLKVGQEYDFQILSIEPKEHRMSLKLAKPE